MKKLILISAVVISSLAALLSFSSCNKNNDQTNTEQMAKQHSDSVLHLYQTFSGGFWKINSEFVNPAINGSTIIAIDSCNRYVTYNFPEPNLNAVIIGGLVNINYNDSPCQGGPRTTNPVAATYSIDVNPNTITFPDNGFNLTPNTYTIVKSSQDSLVLQVKDGAVIYTKVYLSK